MQLFLLLPAICAIAFVASDPIFPKSFLFGATSASYQVEGAWNSDGKGDSIWDHALHSNPNLTADHSNGDIAADSYHKYKDDVQLVKALGVNFYKFSISWPRIMPNGRADKINQKGINYYNNLIDELLAHGIQPYVIMHSWDLPQALQNENGWLNRALADTFVAYARVLFDAYGDRVKVWLTFNEIYQFCEGGYSNGYLAPFVKRPGVGSYECAHTMLLAHGRTYRMYQAEFAARQNGRVSIAVDSYWHEPRHPAQEIDREASEVAMEMNYGWFVNPIVNGNYPDLMIERVAETSNREGYNKSRLPEFTSDEQEMMKGTFDFLAVNHYTTYKVYFGVGAVAHPSHEADTGVIVYQDAAWPNSSSSSLKAVPWGINRLLNWIRTHYQNPPVLIGENGFIDNGQLDDRDRANYYKGYLYEVAKAINEDGCNVIGYGARSLIDGFEWLSGYTKRFGLHYIDFTDPNRTRTRKFSSYVYNHIIITKRIDWDYEPEWPVVIDDIDDDYVEETEVVVLTLSDEGGKPNTRSYAETSFPSLVLFVPLTLYFNIVF